MEVKHLGHTEFEIIMECFLESFQNYFVPMPTDNNYYKARWEAANVDFSLSYGMFDEGRLVAFIINAIEERDGYKIAYNSGTGVIPKYRGQRLVKTIYDYALNQLQQNGITKCTLEVITENTKAIKAYEGVGFKKCKYFKCFNGEITTNCNDNIELKEIDYPEIDWSTIPNQNYYSWDNHRFSLERGNFKFYHVYYNDEIESFFVINPENGYVAQLEVLKNHTNSWERLFKAIALISKTIKINNVDNSLELKLKALETIGLTNTVDQYEMELVF